MPELKFLVAHKSVMESNSTLKIPVQLSAPSAFAVSYAYKLQGGTASLGSDFIFADASSSIAAGEKNDTILLQIVEDATTEVDETILISIQVLSGAGTSADSVYTLTIQDNDVFGFSGPGGVGDSVLNTIWLDAGKITGISNGSAISTQWTDISGNENHASQATGSQQPSLIGNAINSLPVVRFDGVNDFFDNRYSYEAASGIVVLKVNSATQDPTQLAQLFGNYAEGHFAIDARAGAVNRGMSFDGGTSEKGKFRVNGATYTPYVANTAAQKWSYDQYFILTGEFENVLSFSRMVIGSLYPSFTAGMHQFGGDIAEMIVFENHLNLAQNIIIENYLAAKYGISITNDMYAYEATHGHNVVGIGKASSDDIHILSESAGILKLKNPQALSDGAYIFAGHDNQGIAAWDLSNAPNASTRVLERSWRLDITDTTAELGLALDTSSLPILPSGFAAWALLLDKDGDFSSGSAYYLLEKNINGEYSVDNVQIVAGDYIGIAAVKNISAQDGNFDDASTWFAGVPSDSDTAIIATKHNIVLDANAESAHLHLSLGARIELGANTYSINEGSMEVYGTMDMGTGTISYSASGAQSIAAIAYNNLSIDGTGNKTLPSDIVVNGNLLLNSGVLDLNNSGNYTLQVAGNWVNNGGAFEPRNATVELIGLSTQEITTNALQFYDLKVSGNGPYLLQDDASISNQLILESGVISTQGNTLKILSGSSSAISAFSNTSFVYGNLERAINFGLYTYSFPVGKGTGTTQYHPVEIEANLLLGVSTLNVSFTDLVRSDNANIVASDSEIDYESISPEGMWIIHPNQQPITGSYSVKLFLDNMSGIADNDFGIVKRAEGAADASEWSALGSLNILGGLGRLLSDGFALRKNLTSFSEFGIGSGSGSGDALPIELLEFKAYKIAEEAQLEWSTASEVNADYFEVQRADDSQEFKQIGKLEAKGNSIEVVEYQFRDEKPLAGNNYYRLKQVDKNGAFVFLPVEVLNFDAAAKALELSIFPNPAEGNELNINLKNSDLKEVQMQIDIYDAQGKNVFSHGNFISRSNNIKLGKKLPAGIYVVDIQIEKLSQKSKWIVN